MTFKEKKKILKINFLRPKKKLRRERRAREITTEEMASYIGLQRRQYEKKEAGEYPFNDYEMDILSKKLNISIDDLFF